MTEGDQTESDARAPTDSPLPFYKRKVFRLGLLVTLIAGLWAVGAATGVKDELTPQRIREIVEEAGPLGIVVFCAIFMVGQTIQVPGFVFIGAATIAWGPWQGAPIAALGATLAVSFNFFISNRIGGDVTGTKSKLLGRLLARLHKRPMLTMIVTRLLFLTSPPVTVLLALSGVRHRDHTLASAIGMTPSIVGLTIAFEAGMREFGFL